MKEIRQYDVVILGGGLAGIYTALNIDPTVKVGLFIKDKINRGSSELAQGGIAAELEQNEEKFREHLEDTLRAGSSLNDVEATKILVSEAADNIQRLIKLGVEFDKNEKGELLRTMEGAHRSRRILHAGGDATGHCIMEALRTMLFKRENITVFEDEMAIELLFNDNTALGVIVINHSNEEVYVLANKIVLATGGIGGIYKNSTNDKIACGDGIAMAKRANVSIGNMEFVQFHPTALYEEEKVGQKFLISEAVRGEGAILRNIEGVRFMEKYTPLLELAPRDIVSQSIHREMFDTWSDHVYLDITHKDRAFLEKRFPTIFKRCLESGIDMSKDLIPVAPCEHFLCGGISVDVMGHTSMKNLYAVGECANSGVHGANRLASNSLLECIVFAYRIATEINQEKEQFGKIDVILPDIQLAYKPFNFKSIRVEIRDVMDKYVSITRTTEGLALAKGILTRHLENLNKINVLSRYYYETLNMATVALLIIDAATKRTESIGSHYRINK